MYFFYFLEEHCLVEWFFFIAQMGMVSLRWEWYRSDGNGIAQNIKLYRVTNNDSSYT
jgi:hypothetical protein